MIVVNVDTKNDVIYLTAACMKVNLSKEMTLSGLLVFCHCRKHSWNLLDLQSLIFYDSPSKQYSSRL